MINLQYTRGLISLLWTVADNFSFSRGIQCYITLK
jgi:hypothetical protein